MENQNMIRNLLNKYLQGKLTATEQDEFYDLLADNVNEPVFKEIFHACIDEFSNVNSSVCNEADFDKIYGNIISHVNSGRNNTKRALKTSRKQKIFLYFSSVAAVVTAAFMLGRASYPVQENVIPAAPSYTEVTSPYGSRSEIKLPDGTSVILNAGSTIRYGNDFNHVNRDIALNGEAYFKVARNTELPLIVSAGDIDVIATGTEFNIKAYPEETTIETTLIEGKVEITNLKQAREDAGVIDLVPNQKAIFYKEEERYRLEDIRTEAVKPEPVKPFIEKVLIAPKADVEKTVAWTEGRLIFRGENLEHLCVDLQRKYDVKFVFIEEDLKKYRFTGVLLDETLEQVLDVIKLTAPIDFSIEAKTVYLFTDVKQLDGFDEYLK